MVPASEVAHHGPNKANYLRAGYAGPLLLRRPTSYVRVSGRSAGAAAFGGAPARLSGQPQVATPLTWGPAETLVTGRNCAPMTEVSRRGSEVRGVPVPLGPACQQRRVCGRSLARTCRGRSVPAAAVQGSDCEISVCSALRVL